MLTLGIETSCDETSCSVLRNGREVLSNVIASQIDIHKEYGGVVPEIASRKHIESINIIIQEALDKAEVEFEDIDIVGVTQGPGLVGALLIGIASAKAIAYALDIPLIGVNHMEGHVCANYISNKELEPPFICLVVSGGHTYLLEVKGWTEYNLIGRTRDDAAGEAFDKVARSVGLPYPGGPHIDRLAKEGNKEALDFPRAMLGKDSYDFSFSGLKTSVLNYLNQMRQKDEEIIIEDLAASFQESVVEVLVKKTIRLAKEKGYENIVLAGGVASNSRLRELMIEEAKKIDKTVYYPSGVLCTDNAAMIASAAYYNYQAGQKSDLGLKVDPNLGLE